ncbi:MAG: hypothetical protein WCK65_01275 [Rhodospirillaceae bacterium]
MTIAAIDTHAFVKRITAAGMPEPQAEVLAEILAERPAPVSKGAVVAAIQEAAVGTNRRIDATEKRLNEKIAILNENQLETNRALAAIMAHLGIRKP